MEKRIEEINEKIKNLQNECNQKIDSLNKEKDKLLKECSSSYINRYIKYTEDECDYVCKITDVSFLTNGEINYYSVKILTIRGLPYYHNDFTISPSRLEGHYEFISREEFEELVNKGIDLIKKNIMR